MFLPHPRVKLSIVESLCDREVACSASDRQGSNFESEAMPKFLIVMCIYGVFATVSVLRGTLVYLKTKLSTAATPQ